MGFVWDPKSKTERTLFDKACRINYITYKRYTCIIPVCQAVDNEIHFVTKCFINEHLRTEFWNTIQNIDIEFPLLSDEDKFCYLMCNGDPRVLSWYGKFVYQSFQIRNEKVYTRG